MGSKRFAQLAALAAIGASLACNSDPFGTEDLTLLEALRSLTNTTSLASALEGTILETSLQDEGPFTVFAPTDDAFAALAASTRDTIFADPAVAFQVAGYHISVVLVFSNDFDVGGQLLTATRQTITLSTSGGPRIENAAILQTDIGASNGVIHLIDRVLIPPTLQGQILLAAPLHRD